MNYVGLYFAEYHSNDTGETRKYKFRRIKTAKLKFRVKASHDAAICLSVGDDEEPNDIYEVGNYMCNVN